MANRKTLEEQIAQAREEVRQKEARIKQLEARQRSDEDKKRTHRLCKRGGLVERLYPCLAKLTDDEFDVFVEQVLKTDHAKSVLDKLSTAPLADNGNDTNTARIGDNATQKPVEAVTQTEITSAPKPVETAAQTVITPAAKPAQTPNSNGTGGNTHSGNGARQNNGGNTPKPANTPHSNHTNGNAQSGNGARQTG